VAPIWGLRSDSAAGLGACGMLLVLSGHVDYRRLPPPVVASHLQGGLAAQGAAAFFGIFSLQNSILIWAARHRVHHRHVDDVNEDPHSIKTGFWHAHMGWMVRDWPTSKVDWTRSRTCRKTPS
jgi:stearoyl-CoA desaturase (Delta-9 desaturase)